MRANLREANISPVIPFLDCRPQINGLDIHLAAKFQTCFWIYSTWFVIPWRPLYTTGWSPKIYSSDFHI